MILKIIVLFLIAMGALAMFGKLRFPRKGGRKTKAGANETARKCPRCGTYIIGKAGCDCDKSGANRG